MYTNFHPTEPELELIQTHITQKPLMWVEVGAHAVRKRPEFAGAVWVGAGVSRRGRRVALVCVLSLKSFWVVWRRQFSFTPQQWLLCYIYVFVLVGLEFVPAIPISKSP